MLSKTQIDMIKTVLEKSEKNLIEVDHALSTDGVPGYVAKAAYDCALRDLRDALKLIDLYSKGVGGNSL